MNPAVLDYIKKQGLFKNGYLATHYRSAITMQRTWRIWKYLQAKKDSEKSKEPASHSFSVTTRS